MDLSQLPSTKERREGVKKEKRRPLMPKCALLGLGVLVLVAGIVVLVYFKREPEPDVFKGGVVPNPVEPTDDEECAEVEVYLRDRIGFSCYTQDIIRAAASLNIVPPVYVNEGKTVFVNLGTMDTDSRWTAKYKTNLLELVGPNATCSSSGLYRLVFLDHNNRTLHNSTVQIKVKSVIKKVNVSLNQSETTGNKKDFDISCETNSGCEQSFVDFFAEINKEERYLTGMNFSCIITYNDWDGYSVKCEGTIPDYLMSQFGKITCRPRSKLLDELNKTAIEEFEEVLELPECDISKHCGYKCLGDEDYYVVNVGRCDIFHRCYRNTVYTSYCAPGTFFDPTRCTCRHTTELKWCQENGALKKGHDISGETCKIKE